jgi:hypothetical protein
MDVIFGKRRAAPFLLWRDEGVGLRPFLAAQMFRVMPFDQGNVGVEGLAVTTSTGLLVAVVAASAQHEEGATPGREFVQSAARGVRDPKYAARPVRLPLERGLVLLRSDRLRSAGSRHDLLSPLGPYCLLSADEQ